MTNQPPNGTHDDAGSSEPRRDTSIWIAVAGSLLLGLAVVKGIHDYVSADRDGERLSSEEYDTFRQSSSSSPQVPGGETTTVSHGELPAAARPLIELEEGYAGSQTCQECHTRQHATWYASYHRTMTQLATPATVVGDFNNVELSFHGKVCRLSQQDDGYWVEIEDLTGNDAAGDPLTERKRIVQTTGSHHFQAYWYPSGHSRQLTMLPFSFRIDEQRWVPIESAFLTAPRTHFEKGGGRWNRVCSGCHATRVQPQILGPNQLETRVVELGISCEACHGPGEQHVSVADQGDDLKIVNPAKVAPRRSAEICGQCHSITTALTEEDYRAWHMHGLTYRPGDILADFRFVVSKDKFEDRRVQAQLQQNEHFLDNHFWSDGIVRVSGREYNGLIESPCYQHDDESRTMTCLSCHALHGAENDDRPLPEWADDQLQPGMRGNLGCVQCHAEYNDEQALVQHTHHQAGSSGSNCYNCHMSYTTYGLLKAIRSHTIESPSVESTLATGRPHACNGCHLDKSLGWTADHLQLWYGKDKPRMTDDEQTIAASVLWALKGDAGQRALTAWSMAWPPAREISGHDWLTPYVAELLTDDYDAVRFIAQRALRQQPGLDDFDYDFLAETAQREQAAKAARQLWAENARNAPGTTGKAILISPDGRIDTKVFDRLLHERDRRAMYLNE